MDVLGIDDHPRNLEVANFLRNVSGLDRIRFLHADANSFRNDETYDLVVHFGTLDHLKHPMQALEHVAAMFHPTDISPLNCKHTKMETTKRCASLSRTASTVITRVGGF